MFERIKAYLFKKDRLNRDNDEPKTFEEAVDFVAERLDPTAMSSGMFHFAGGMSLRNDLKLWHQDSALHKHMVERFGLCHADDTGALIANAADAKLNGSVYDPAADIEVFKAHWRRMGLDPATMERLPSPPIENADIVVRVGHHDVVVRIENQDS